MKGLKTGLAALLLLASVASAQEIEPETVTVRVSNPFQLYGTLYVECGPFARNVGLIVPEGVTTVPLKIVDLCDLPGALLTVAFEGGGKVSFYQEKLALDDPDVPKRGVLICLDAERMRGDAWVIPDSLGVEVPMACPREGDR